MEQIFTQLGRAVEGTPLMALGAAFVWGILSLVLSPCHLASIPLVVSFISDQGRVTARRAFWTATVFAVGILLAIAVIGMVTAAAGRMMGDVGRYGNHVVAAVFFAVGLSLVGVISLPWTGACPAGMKRKGLLAAFILGLVFGVALGPCTFAYMAPMLGATFRLASSNLLFGVLLLLAYGVGHCAVIVVAGASTERVQRVLDWNDRSKGLAVLRIACGILVLLGGLWLVYTAP